MARYANKTEVPQSRSIQEIERTLDRYGAEAFAYGKSKAQVVVQFSFSGKPYQISVDMPDPESKEFTHLANGWERRAEGPKQKLIEQAGRQRLRALLLYIKASLEAADSELWPLEQVFLHATLIADGVTVGDRLLPEIELIQESGKLPKLLPGG